MDVMESPTEAQLKKATATLVQAFHPIVLYLFGSSATGRMRFDSDIDFAFLSDLPVTSYQAFILAQEIANIVNRDVDLVNLREATTVMQAEVVAGGVRLYERNWNDRCEYEMRTFKAYAMLNEERQCVFEAMRERGSAF